jgi:hypothetical protein
MLSIAVMHTCVTFEHISAYSVLIICFTFQIKTKQTDPTDEVENVLATREKSADVEQKPQEVNNSVFRETSPCPSGAGQIRVPNTCKRTHTKNQVVHVEKYFLQV